MNDDLDPDQRPASYFAPQDAGQDLLATVAGSAARELVRSLLAEGRYAEARVVAGASDALRSLESVHPMFMGGDR